MSQAQNFSEVFGLGMTYQELFAQLKEKRVMPEINKSVQVYKEKSELIKRIYNKMDNISLSDQQKLRKTPL